MSTPNFSKHYAEVIIADPTAVAAQCSAVGQLYQNGAVFCTCEEIGYDTLNMVYVRYGLSLPYMRLQEGWKIWIEPTIGDTERWIYTGIADAGEETVGTNVQLAITLLQGLLYQNSLGQIYITDPGASEAFVKGTTFKPEIEKHKALMEELQTAINNWVPTALDGGAALKTALASFLVMPLPDYKNILSLLIYGE